MAAGHRRGRGAVTRNTVQPWWVRDLVPLAVQGYGDTQIAKRTGRARNTVQNAMKHPAIREAIAKARAVTWEKAGARIAAMMVDDTPKNIAFLQAVRDNELAGARPQVRDRIQASTRLMDSQLARKTASTQQISGSMAVGLSVISPDDAIDITELAKQAGIDLPCLPPPAEEA